MLSQSQRKSQSRAQDYAAYLKSKGIALPKGFVSGSMDDSDSAPVSDSDVDIEAGIPVQGSATIANRTQSESVKGGQGESGSVRVSQGQSGQVKSGTSQE